VVVPAGISQLHDPESTTRLGFFVTTICNPLENPMALKLLLPGIEQPLAKKDLNLAPFLKPDIKTARKVDAVSRGFGDAALTEIPADAQGDDIVEMEFENAGRRWKQWVTLDQLNELREKRVSRDGGEELYFIPPSWESKEASRGIGTIALKALKIFGIDTGDQFVEKGAKVLASSIAGHFESDIEKQGHPFGLYRFPDPREVHLKHRITEAKPLTGLGPFLIFLHGTASSSVGSFGKLAGTTEWSQLQAHYGENILALDHRTFTDSPIRNALDLARLLPDGAQLHLVSHSRGGLVGELICLAQAGEGLAKFAALTKKFRESAGDDAALVEERTKQLDQLRELWELLVKKRFNIRRFVRVACPAHGTTLAGKRMDVLASGLLNAIGMIPAIDQTPLVDVGYDWAKSLLLTLIKKKADPRELPGIEAMIPDSPLIEFLNHPELSTQADLAVISGDIEVGNLKLTIPALLGNAFFWAKNDLVVNTKSMTHGLRRAHIAHDLFDQGAVVCHFNYFYNPETRKKLAEWLLWDRGEDPPAQFKPIIRSERSAPGAPAAGEPSITEWLEKEEPMAPTDVEYELRVSVAHGDLRHARYPVAVGHYEGDGIISAEKYLDILLGGRLANRYGMRLYPGPVGTAAVVHAPAGQKVAGALVIGLGEMGQINADIVREGVTAALLQYALSVMERPADAKPKGPAASYRSAAISALLIGTYGGNALQVKESVGAILQAAMQANRVLQAQGLWERIRIDEIEFVEIYEDVAIQAIHAVYEIEELRMSEYARGVTLRVDPVTLKTPGGGRYQRPVSGLDTYWYGRIQITAGGGSTGEPAHSLLPRLPKILDGRPEFRAAHRAFVDKLIEESVKMPQKRSEFAEMVVDLMQGGPARSRAGSLEFQVLTDRARVEASMQATQRQLVDWMVEQTVNTTRYDKDLSISLFELLIPNALKERTENVVLQLDREAAQYPWELMTERSQPDRPLATRMGLLRQFKTDDFRANPRPARTNTALVIGDTINTGLAELLGAQEEAQTVAGLLERDSRYEVRALLKAPGRKVINELFAREYQILHIAAHGNFDADNPDHSGVVLDDGRYLTAQELVNLRTIPDLVFINCCHLGRMERLPNESPNRLAASVAEELIKMGVKAVVAAGWAVDDASAVTFARMFYDRMLAGESFGEAVLRARKETHREHSDTNTWGAYQCYGNPNFRLNLRGSSAGKSAGFYSRREYRDTLRSIAAATDAHSVRRNRANRADLYKIEKDMPKEYFSDGEVLSDFGEAWFTLGNFEEAIRFYELAIRTDDAKAALRSFERLANVQSRYATQLWEIGRSRAVSSRRASAEENAAAQAERASIRRKIEEAGKLLDWLITMGGTSERYALRGKVFKCEALMAADAAEREAKLRKAADLYETSYERAKKEEKDFIFPAVNLIACRLSLPDPDRQALSAIITDCITSLANGLSLGSSFWTHVVRPELALLQHLVVGDLAASQDEVLIGYDLAIDAGMRPSDAESVVWQMQFLAAMLEHRDAPSAQAINAIRTRLLEMVDAANR
jgi:CHAT domain-containing protein